MNMCPGARHSETLKSILFYRHVFVIIIKTLNVHQFPGISAGHLPSKSRGRDASQSDYDIINTGCSLSLCCTTLMAFSVGSARESHAELNFDHTTGFVLCSKPALRWGIGFTIERAHLDSTPKPASGALTAAKDFLSQSQTSEAATRAPELSWNLCCWYYQRWWSDICYTCLHHSNETEKIDPFAKLSYCCSVCEALRYLRCT